MFSKVVRQTHMYVALFLTPWLLLYSLSTITMNHRDLFRKYYGGQPAQWQKESEQPLNIQFNPDTKPREMGEQVLKELGMSGNSRAFMSQDGKQLIISRDNAIVTRRITYTPAENKVLVEKQEFRTQPFLERMHTRRGFGKGHLMDDLWAASVDSAIIGILLWVVTGLWMWWELKVTRRLGAIFALAGLALFALLIFNL